MCRYVSYTNTGSQALPVSEEHCIYGSSHLGMDQRSDTLFLVGAYTPTWCGTSSARRELGNKHYELSNHLGNVLLSVTDKKAYKTLGGSLYFEAEITTISDYYPFGSTMQTRAYRAVGYRWGFNGQAIEGDNLDGTYDFGARFYNSALGRWLSIDPLLFSGKVEFTPYQGLANIPITFFDPNGMDEFQRILIRNKETCVIESSVMNRTSGKYEPIQRQKDNELDKHDYHIYYSYHDIVNTQICERDNNGTLVVVESFTTISPSQVYTRHPIFRWVPHLREKKQHGGWRLVSGDGGIDPTKYKSTKEASTIDIGNFLIAAGVLGKTPKVWPKFPKLDDLSEIYEIAGYGSDLTSAIRDMTSEIKKREEAILESARRSNFLNQTPDHWGRIVCEVCENLEGKEHIEEVNQKPFSHYLKK